MTQKISYLLIFGSLLLTAVFFALLPGQAAEAQTPGQADLVVTELTRLEDRLFAGNQGSYKAVVKNIGTWPATGFMVAMIFNQDPVCSHELSLEPSQSVDIWCGYGASAGSVLFEVVADEGYSVREINELNNKSLKNFTVLPATQRPDIQVLNPIEVNSGSLYAGTEATLTVHVQNLSAWPTGSFGSAWYLNSQTDPICTIAVSLAAGTGRFLSCTINLTEPGEVTVIFRTDPDNLLAETNESNNSVTTSFNIQPSLGTDSGGPEPIPLPTPAVLDVPEVVVPTTFEGQAEQLRGSLPAVRNISQELYWRGTYMPSLFSGLSSIPYTNFSALVYFITYGVDDKTQALGAGERAAVLFSYKEAFGKVPQTVAELADMLRIASGRWPTKLSLAAQDKAHAEFYKIYGRVANMQISRENAAITIMAYGLRQQAQNRNLASEKSGLQIFKAIYDHLPKSTFDWNIMQAITYSGVTR